MRLVGLGILLDLVARSRCPKFRQFAHVGLVQTSENFAALASHLRSRIGKFIVAQNLTRNGLTLDPVHHKTATDPVLRGQHQPYGRNRHAKFFRELYQLGFRFKACRRLALRPFTARRPPQNKGHRFTITYRVKRPGLLTGATGKPPQVLDGAYALDLPSNRCRKRPGNRIHLSAHAFSLTLTGTPSTI